jgi:hypothetical protein
MESEQEGRMSKEQDAFNMALEKVLSVSHAEIKQRETEQKSAKMLAPRKRKAKKPSASGRVSRGKD